MFDGVEVGETPPAFPPASHSPAPFLPGLTTSQARSDFRNISLPLEERLPILIYLTHTLKYGQSSALAGSFSRLCRHASIRMLATANLLQSDSRLYSFSPETKEKLRKFRLGTSRAKDAQAIICTAPTHAPLRILPISNLNNQYGAR